MATLRTISLNDILTEKSSLLFPPTFLSGSNGNTRKNSPLYASLDALSMLSPPVVYMENNQEFHLVDGLGRVTWLAERKKGEAPCMVLDRAISPADLGMYILAVHNREILSTATCKACFCAFLHNRGVEQEKIIDDFMPLLEMNSHAKIFAQCLRIASMPENVLQFCHEKGFSLKKCINIARHEKEMLQRVFALRQHLSLSASVLEEILSSLRDISRMHETDCNDILDSGEARHILEEDIPGTARTARFRNFLKELRQPVLTEVNARIMSGIREMNLPGNVRVDYDKTLENRNVTIVISVKNRDELERGVRAVSHSKTLNGIMEILREL